MAEKSGTINETKLRKMLETLRHDCIWQLDDCLMAGLAQFLADYLSNPDHDLPEILKIPLEVNLSLKPHRDNLNKLLEEDSENAAPEAFWPGDRGFAPESDSAVDHLLEVLREKHKKRLENAVKSL